jgi:hypothetical protein
LLGVRVRVAEVAEHVGARFFSAFANTEAERLGGC